MATGVGRKKNKKAIASTEWPVPENPLIDATIWQISLTQAELWPILSQISLPWQRGSTVGKYKCHRVGEFKNQKNVVNFEQEVSKNP